MFCFYSEKLATVRTAAMMVVFPVYPTCSSCIPTSSPKYERGQTTLSKFSASVVIDLSARKTRYRISMCSIYIFDVSICSLSTLFYDEKRKNIVQNFKSDIMYKTHLMTGTRSLNDKTRTILWNIISVRL